MKESPGGWERTSIGEICRAVSQSVSPQDAGDLPYVGLDGINPGTTVVARVSTTEGLQSSVKRFEDGDTIYARLRPYLNKVGAPRFKGVASSEFLVLRSPVLAPRFLMHLLSGSEFVRFASRVSEGTHRPRVRWEQMAAYEVLLPSLAEQRRIVAAIEEQFSRLDAAEESLKRAQVRVFVFRATAYSAALAEDWPSVPLGEVLREPLRNGHSARASSNGEGVRTLTLTAVTRGEFTTENTKMTTADPVRVEHLWLQDGDLFVERSNTPDLVGTAALYRGPDRWSIFPDLLIRVRVSDALLPEFLNVVLKSRSARSYFRSSAQGIAGSMPKIDQGVVERLRVPLPPLEDQRRIVDEVEQRLSVIDAMRAAIESAQKRSNALRRSILELAFTGKLVPQDPGDEPASVLLERIRAERAAGGPVRGRRVRSGD